MTTARIFGRAVVWSAVLVLVLAPSAAAQTSRKTVSKAVKAEPTSTDIKGFRVLSQGHDRVELEVDYAYDGRFGRDIALSAKMASEGTASPYAACMPGKVEPTGHGTARVTLRTDKNPPASFTTDQLVLAMYIGGSYVFLEEVFPFEKTWTKMAQMTLAAPLARIGLAAPAQVSPPDGSEFGHYPRATTLTWEPVTGAASYTVEIDCHSCCVSGSWCTDHGEVFRIVEDISETTYRFDFVGAQPGRWRVWAVGSDGRSGSKSGWWEFSYSR
jgi:hypothetical protein